jgi:hypothetical protein
MDSTFTFSGPAQLLVAVGLNKSRPTKTRMNKSPSAAMAQP